MIFPFYQTIEQRIDCAWKNARVPGRGTALIVLMSICTTTICIAQGGALDLSFNPGSGAGGGSAPNIYSVSLQSDGKIIIGGDFTTVDGSTLNHIARLNADGSVDQSFNPGQGVAGLPVPSALPPFVAATAVQPDGKILIGGRFFFYDGTGRNQFARLNSDGSLDTSFDPGGGPNNYDLNAIALQPDGKILIGGVFTAYNGVSRERIARVNADGSLDESFSGGVTGDGTVHAITVQPDGKFLVGGYFSSYNGETRGNLVRLNPDGSIDNSFAAGAGAQGSVYSISLQSDEKIIIGGPFITYNGVDRLYHARLNADGSLDDTFITGLPNNPNSGQSSFVRSTAVQADGKIIIAGEFTYYDNDARGCIARLNSDGSLDDTFNPGTGAVWGYYVPLYNPMGAFSSEAISPHTTAPDAIRSRGFMIPKRLPASMNKSHHTPSGFIPFPRERRS